MDHVGKPTKKRHHQIPQFYLRRFTSPETAEIWTYDKQTGDVRPSLVKNTAYEGHLYSLTLDDGERFTEIEELLARLEDKAAPLLEKGGSDGWLHAERDTDVRQRATFSL